MPTARAGGWKSIYKTLPGDRLTPVTTSRSVRGPTSLAHSDTDTGHPGDFRCCNFAMADGVL